MAESSDDLTHPIFGTLRWEPDDGTWFTQVHVTSGDVIDLLITPYDEDRFAFLTRASELFQWAMVNERRILAQAVEVELLELYNNTWRRGVEPVVSAADLMAKLEWHVLCVNADAAVSLDYGYGAGALFGNHGLSVEVDENLRFRGIDLLG
jgi:hypothetical protein